MQLPTADIVLIVTVKHHGESPHLLHSHLPLLLLLLQFNAHLRELTLQISLLLNAGREGCNYKYMYSQNVGVFFLNLSSETLSSTTGAF